MAKDDSPHIGQTDAGALEISRSMESLKHAKELVGITHIEPDPIIANEKNVFGAGLDAADFNTRLLAGSGVFESIADQVNQHLSKQGRVGANFRQFTNGPFHLAIIGLVTQIPDHRL